MPTPPHAPARPRRPLPAGLDRDRPRVQRVRLGKAALGDQLDRPGKRAFKLPAKEDTQEQNGMKALVLGLAAALAMAASATSAFAAKTDIPAAARTAGMAAAPT